MNWRSCVLLLTTLLSVFTCTAVADEGEGWGNTDYYSQVRVLQQLINSEINKELRQRQFEKDLARILMDSAEDLQSAPQKKSYLWFKSKPSSIPIQTRVSIGQSLQPHREELNKQPKGLFRYGRK
ncbi:uncharacterized protein LOC133173391 [Saccostrea echinata]|uniref:uncharacterized protein LOC133173391 n=1 Tax=Saccostrea echinata TaxID=191078 RepID=UPI002A7FF5C0|nr:uncharacterized protein LOC133173391 [Saccostrea echinata]